MMGISLWALAETFGMAKPCRNVTVAATMKEDPSHNPKREIKVQQTSFGRIEERDSSDQSRCKGEKVDRNKSFKSGNFSSLFAISLEENPFWLIKSCLIRVNPVATDRGHI
ncbi:hypothetical protein F2Q70_00004221 [Brassica cretica]|uniref:Uncharacterized protein n=1 Tax=Brassica cretica TaxID=69181 RepID=A0A8S9J242_BRACR|nr:hypothetical protein F2Q70_00004221 [Brassica cretica]